MHTDPTQEIIKTNRRTSSGGVVYRMNDGVEVVLIAHLSQKGTCVWCLPKGTVECGESLEETALREVREETGISGRILEKLGEIQYEFYSKQDRDKIFKTVHFYLLVYLSGNEHDHDNEADEARWFSIHEAEKQLTHPNERAILRKAIAALLNVAAVSPPTSLSQPLNQP